jgi:hypothetical protein
MAAPQRDTNGKRGQSGNPTGRKKGQRNFKTLLAEELASSIEITEGGRSRKLSKKELLAKTIVARALKGDVQVLRLMLQQWSEEDMPAEKPLTDSEKAIVFAFLAMNGKGDEKS